MRFLHNQIYNITNIHNISKHHKYSKLKKCHVAKSNTKIYYLFRFETVFAFAGNEMLNVVIHL